MEPNQIIPIKDRLAYYLNAPQSQRHLGLEDDVYQGGSRMYNENRALFKYKKYKGSFLEWYCREFIRLKPFSKIRSLPKYRRYRNLLTLSDFLNLFHDAPEKIKKSSFLLYHGEKELETDMPFIRKARKVEDENSVLFKLSTIRHFDPCKEAQKDDINWYKKNTDIVWRGATTSAKYRNAFVERYAMKYNIGFSTMKQYPNLACYAKPILSIKQQLNFKYIVSLEGYDLASNLKWILCSNSVPVMPKPTWVSWIMEDKLEPYIHYLPLNDRLDNLEELLSWAKENDSACQEIAENGKEYMSQFFDDQSEKKIQQELLACYSELFTFNSPTK